MPDRHFSKLKLWLPRFIFLWTLGFNLNSSLADQLRDGGARLRLPEDQPLLFVTHPTVGYDHSMSASDGIYRVTGIFEERNWPVIYLNDCDSVKQPGDHVDTVEPYLGECHPSVNEICSLNGEHEVNPRNPHIFITGGYFDKCSANTRDRAATAAIASQIRRSKKPLIVLHYVLDAIYTGSCCDAANKNLGQLFKESVTNPSNPNAYSQEILQAFFYSTVLGQEVWIEAWALNHREPEYRVELYYENTFIAAEGKEPGPNTVLVIIRLTTSESIAQNPNAHNEFLQRRLTVRKQPAPTKERAKFRVPIGIPWW